MNPLFQIIQTEFLHTRNWTFFIVHIHLRQISLQNHHRYQNQVTIRSINWYVHDYVGYSVKIQQVGFDRDYVVGYCAVKIEQVGVEVVEIDEIVDCDVVDRDVDDVVGVVEIDRDV